MLPARCARILGLLATLTACGGTDAPPSIGLRFAYEAPAPVAGPAVGADDRCVVARAEAPGAFETREARDGRPLEGPFDALPTDHAPAIAGANVYLVARISGRLQGLDLAGQEVAVPSLALGNTGPLVAGPDGRLRVVANAGTLHIVPLDGGAPIEADVGGVGQGAPAVDAAGVTYVATDLGRLVGVDAAGAVVFDQTVNAPASGPSVGADRVAVGTLDGVAVFGTDGAALYTAPRAARVIGTRVLADGDVIAWGEDGALERYDPSGAVRFRLDLGPPIHAEAQALTNGHFGIVDDEGTAYLVSPEGEILDQRTVGEGQTGAPHPRTAALDNLFYVARGAVTEGLDFDLRL